MIKTFADCPYRCEFIKTREEVLYSYDWESGLCPNTCPSSPRNSDYSSCNCSDKDDHLIVPECKHGGTSFSVNGGDEDEQEVWCEALLAMKKCPMGYVR